MTTKKLRLLYNRTVLYFQTEAEFLNYIVMFPGNRAVAYCADSKKTYLHNGGTSNTIADFDIVEDENYQIKRFSNANSYSANSYVVHNKLIYRANNSVSPPYGEKNPFNDSTNWQLITGNTITRHDFEYFSSALKTKRNPSANVTLNYNWANYVANNSGALSNVSANITGVIAGRDFNPMDQNFYFFNNGTTPSVTTTARKTSTTLPTWIIGDPSPYTANISVNMTATATTVGAITYTFPSTMTTDFSYIIVGGGGGGAGGSGSGSSHGGGGGEGGQVITGTMAANVVANRSLILRTGAGGAGTAGTNNYRSAFVAIQGNPSAIYESGAVFLHVRGGNKGQGAGGGTNLPGQGGTGTGGMDGATGRGWGTGTTVVSSGTAPVFSTIADGITSVGYARGGDGGGSTGTSVQGATGAAGATPGSGGGGGQGSGNQNTGGAGGVGAAGAFYLSYTNGGSVTRVNWTTAGSYSHTVPSTATNIQYLLIAGGGGGGGGGGTTVGAGGGGGEGGEWITATDNTMAGQTLTIVVGAGGTGEPAGGGGASILGGSSGYDSYVVGQLANSPIVPVVAIGGRGGMSSPQSGANETRVSVGGTGGPGADGGIGGAWSTNNGSGLSGSNGTTVPTVGTYTGRVLGGGGAGGSSFSFTGPTGGTGGGGAGGNGSVNAAAAGGGVAGTANTGGGGGGGGAGSTAGAGGAGGSGIVVAHYAAQSLLPIRKSSYWAAVAGSTLFSSQGNVEVNTSLLDDQLQEYRDALSLLCSLSGMI